MANRIKIRRGSGIPSTSSLLSYELGWDTSNKVLYINNNSSIVPIADGFLKILGTSLASGDNVNDVGYGLFYSASSARSSELTGGVPYTENGFRFFSFKNYSTSYNFQIATGTNSIKVRFKNDSTWRDWETICYNSYVNNYALPLAGGTMNDEVRINFPITRKKDGGGGWAYTPIILKDNTSTDFFHIGVYGSANTFNYGFIGSNGYDSTENFRIYSNGSIRANGGTLTENLYVTKSSPYLFLKNTSMNTKASSLNDNIYTTMGFLDNNGYYGAYLQNGQDTDGVVSLTICARHRNSSDDGNLQNYFTLKIAPDGTKSVTFSNPTAWREGLGVVNKSGDTMTGSLKISKSASPSVIIEDTTNTGLQCSLLIGSGHQNHGVYSYGYAPTTSTFTSNQKWMVYRSSSGDVILNGIVSNYYSTVSSVPTIAIRSYNQDVIALQVGHASSETGAFSNNYKLIYKGINSTPNNYLQLMANNSSTDTIAMQIDENGNVTFSKTIISGSCAVIRDSGTIARKIFVVSTAGSTSVPSGAVNGDIVLVKV